MKKLLICIVLLIILIALAVCYFVLIKPKTDFDKNRKRLEIKKYSSKIGTDKIHFLNTENSDAILLESNGHFALIDAGEDNDNPRGFESLNLKGFEDRVLAYLKENAADSEGKVTLDFVLGTHSHSDHIGGFDTIILDDDVSIGKAYLKEYNESKIVDYEVQEWDNKEVYEQMVNALNSRNVPIISSPGSEPFTLGNFKITLFNTVDNDTEKVGENDRSFGVLVEKGGTRVFLAGDIDNKSGDEARLGPEIGKVNLLKVGHHSYSGSTTGGWLRNLKPDYCVVTNTYERADKNTLSRITRITSAPILFSGSENGIVAVFGDDGKLSFYNDIH